MPALSGPGPLTLFGPTNAAFAAYLTANGLTAAELLADPGLKIVLQNHVVSG